MKDINTILYDLEERLGVEGIEDYTIDLVIRVPTYDEDEEMQIWVYDVTEAQAVKHNA